MTIKEGWFRRTKKSMWEHLLVSGHKFYRNGKATRPFNFMRIWDAAYLASNVGIWRIK